MVAVYVYFLFGAEYFVSLMSKCSELKAWRSNIENAYQGTRESLQIAIDTALKLYVLLWIV